MDAAGELVLIRGIASPAMEGQSSRRNKLGSEGLGLVLSGLAVALAVSALAVSFVIPGPVGSPGMNSTELWAAVHGNGTLARGAGVSSSKHTGTGLYQVTFDRDVTNCSYQVTVGSLTPVTYVEAGFASVSPGSDSNGTGGNVYVRTANVGGAWTDYDFFLAIYC